MTAIMAMLGLSPAMQEAILAGLRPSKTASREIVGRRGLGWAGQDPEPVWFPR
jgi:hypothetical protein